MRSITLPPQMRFIIGMMTSHTRKEPQQITKAYLSPMMYPRPSTAAPVLSLRTTFALSATTCPQCITVVEMVSPQTPKVATMKSYRPPMMPLISSVLAPLPPASPLTSTWVVAVASGNGYLPCISLTKYFLNGIRNRMPSTPPSREENTICQKLMSRPRM